MTITSDNPERKGIKEALETFEYISKDIDSCKQTLSSIDFLDIREQENSALSTLLLIRHRVEYSISYIKPSIFRNGGYLNAGYAALLLFIGSISLRLSETEEFTLNSRNVLLINFFLLFFIGQTNMIEYINNKSGNFRNRTWRYLLATWWLLFLIGIIFPNFGLILWLILLMSLILAVIKFINA